MALRIHLDENGKTRTDIPELRLVYKLKSEPVTTKKVPQH